MSIWRALLWGVIGGKAAGVAEESDLGEPGQEIVGDVYDPSTEFE
jgi:hypothetical protein